MLFTLHVHNLVTNVMTDLLLYRLSVHVSCDPLWLWLMTACVSCDPLWLWLMTVCVSCDPLWLWLMTACMCHVTLSDCDSWQHACVMWPSAVMSWCSTSAPSWSPRSSRRRKPAMNWMPLQVKPVKHCIMYVCSVWYLVYCPDFVM